MFATIVLFGAPGTIIGIVQLVHYVDSISVMVGQKMLYSQSLQYLFERVLEKEGCEDVILRGKVYSTPPISDNFFGKMKVYVCDYLPEEISFHSNEIIRMLIIFALMFFPILGPVLLCFYNAPQVAHRCHGRYFDLKGFSRQRRFEYFRENENDYMIFGIITNFICLVPVLSFFITFTTAVSGALWAARIETELRKKNKPLGQATLEI